MMEWMVSEVMIQQLAHHDLLIDFECLQGAIPVS